MKQEIRDLFGTVETPQRGRGRPSHVPTTQNANKVARLLIAGCPKIGIARALGITMPTLRRHYFRKKTGNKIGGDNHG